MKARITVAPSLPPAREGEYTVCLYVDGVPSLQVEPLSRQGAHDWTSGCRAGIETSSLLSSGRMAEVEIVWL
jgi:hypothetical protein